MVNRDEIIKKLGFDPILDPFDPDSVPDYEDDITPNPFSVLSDEEAYFITEELLEAKRQGRLPSYPKEK